MTDRTGDARPDEQDDDARAPRRGSQQTPETTGRWGRCVADIDDGQPSVARIWNFYLDGGSNRPSDRAFGREVQVILPDYRELAVAACQFVNRAVRFALDQGVRQILDVGAGIPTLTEMHEIAWRVDPACRVVYVDNESVAAYCLRQRVGGDPRLGVVNADARDVRAVLTDPVTAAVLDVSEPVVVVMSLLLHFIPDRDDPAGMIRRYSRGVAPGSFLVLSQGTADGREDDMAEIVAVYERVNRPLIVRDRQEFAGVVAGLRVVDPGIVYAPLWRPEHAELVPARPERSCVYVAVAEIGGDPSW